jgi:hypothetical protein
MTALECALRYVRSAFEALERGDVRTAKINLRAAIPNLEHEPGVCYIQTDKLAIL